MRPRYLEVLSEEEVVQIDTESRRILAECGVKVLHDEAHDLLEAVGCKVDRVTSMVRMPPEVVQKAIDATNEKLDRMFKHHLSK